ISFDSPPLSKERESNKPGRGNARLTREGATAHRGGDVGWGRCRFRLWRAPFGTSVPTLLRGAARFLVVASFPTRRQREILTAPLDGERHHAEVARGRPGVHRLDVPAQLGFFLAIDFHVEDP